MCLAPITLSTKSGHVQACRLVHGLYMANLTKCFDMESCGDHYQGAESCGDHYQGAESCGADHYQGDESCGDKYQGDESCGDHYQGDESCGDYGLPG